MNEIQERLATLQDKGWTLAAIADEVGVTVNAVEKWKAGRRYPANVQGRCNTFGHSGESEASAEEEAVPKTGLMVGLTGVLAR